MKKYSCKQISPENKGKSELVKITNCIKKQAVKTMTEKKTEGKKDTNAQVRDDLMDGYLKMLDSGINPQISVASDILPIMKERPALKNSEVFDEYHDSDPHTYYVLAVNNIPWLLQTEVLLRCEDTGELFLEKINWRDFRSFAYNLNDEYIQFAYNVQKRILKTKGDAKEHLMPQELLPLAGKKITGMVIVHDDKNTGLPFRKFQLSSINDDDRFKATSKLEKTFGKELDKWALHDSVQN